MRRFTFAPSQEEKALIQAIQERVVTYNQYDVLEVTFTLAPKGVYLKVEGVHIGQVEYDPSGCAASDDIELAKMLEWLDAKYQEELEEDKQEDLRLQQFEHYRDLEIEIRRGL